METKPSIGCQQKVSVPACPLLAAALLAPPHLAALGGAGSELLSPPIFPPKLVVFWRGWTFQQLEQYAADLKAKLEQVERSEGDPLADIAAVRAGRTCALSQQLAFCAQYMDERIRGGERVNAPISYTGSPLGNIVLAGANGATIRAALNTTETKEMATIEVGVTGCATNPVGVNRPNSQLMAIATLNVNKPQGEVALCASGTGPGVNWPGQGTVPVASKEKPAASGSAHFGGESQNMGTNQNPFLAKQGNAGPVVPFLSAIPTKLPSCIKLVWMKKIEGKEVRTETLLRDPQKIAAFYNERAKRAAMRAGLARAPPAKAEPERGARQTGTVLIKRKSDLNGMKADTEAKVGLLLGGTGERQPMLRLTANLPRAKKRKADVESNVCAICLEEWDADRQRVIILAAKGAHKCNHALYCNRCLEVFFRKMRAQAEKDETGGFAYRCPSNCDLGAKKP